MTDSNYINNLKKAQIKLKSAYNAIQMASIDNSLSKSLRLDIIKGDIAKAIMELNEEIYPPLIMMSGE